MSDKVLGVISFFGLFLGAWMTYMVGWSNGWRARQAICPINISRVIMQDVK